MLLSGVERELLCVAQEFGRLSYGAGNVARRVSQLAPGSLILVALVVPGSPDSAEVVPRPTVCALLVFEFLPVSGCQAFGAFEFCGEFLDSQLPDSEESLGMGELEHALLRAALDAYGRVLMAHGGPVEIWTEKKGAIQSGGKSFNFFQLAKIKLFSRVYQGIIFGSTRKFPALAACE